MNKSENEQLDKDLKEFGIPYNDDWQDEEVTCIESYSFRHYGSSHEKKRILHLVAMPPEMQAELFRDVDKLIAQWMEAWTYYQKERGKK